MWLQACLGWVQHAVHGDTEGADLTSEERTDSKTKNKVTVMVIVVEVMVVEVKMVMVIVVEVNDGDSSEGLTVN